MKRAALVLRAFLVSEVGIEGLFLALGTACLAIASAFVSPAGPWAVIGVMALVVGLLMAVPRRAG